VRAGNQVIEKLFADAQRCLRPTGVLWVVLRTAQGAKSWRKKLETQFGQCETMAIEGGYRILKSVK
jgi:16S rRNA (guanine1207-N2)-methyltransferase